MYFIKKSFVTNIEDVRHLFDEYEEECKISTLPSINPDVENIKRLEDFGMCNTIFVYERLWDKPIGFGMVVITPLLKYSIKTAITEAIFISKEHRKGIAGLRLIKELEKLAKDMGASHYFISAPSDSQFNRVLQKTKGYDKASQSYVKALR